MLRKIFVFFIMILGLTTQMYAHIHDLPDLGNPSAQSLTLAEENKLGEEFMQQIRHSIPLVTDPIVEDYIEELGQKLATHSKVDDRTFHFFVVRSPEINAFAGPGGYIGVNSGLILLANKESELAGVMAHEIAHVSQRHIARSFEKAKGLNLATTAAMIGSIALATVDPSLGSGALAATVGGSQQSRINFTRSNEEEADRVGIETLYDAGFDPDSMANFFQRMQRNNYSGASIPEFLSTHPLYNSRISDAQNITANLKKKEYRESMKFGLIKERLRVDISSNMTKLLQSYKSAIPKVTGKQKQALEYGYALALEKDSQFSKARDVILKLRNQDKWQLLYILALANNDLKTNRVSQGLKLYQDYHEFYPDSYPLTILYAEALKNHGQAQKSISIYYDAIRFKPTDPILYGKLSRAYAEAGNKFEAYLARATAYQLVGNYQLAIQQVKQAAQFSGTSSHRKARVEAKRKELEQAYEASQ